MIRRFCVIAVIAAATCAAFAPISRATAATAASACEHQQLASVKRSLSSANSSKLQRYCQLAHKSLTTVRFIVHHPVLVAPRYKVWWKVPDKKWRHMVRKNRAVLRQNQRQLAKVEARIQSLTYPSWLKNAFECIHGFEGAWTSNTGNGYFGGLQMDLGFQSSYGPEFLARWGTADNWPKWAQLEAAKRAYESGRGFTPWPNTAHFCGLL